MTAEEAIKELKYRIKLSKRACLKSMPKQIKVFEVAIEALEKVEEYKRLEEQGLLLRLPCKVGDVVYQIRNKRHAEGVGIAERRVSCINIYSTNNYSLLHQGMTECYSRELNKTWFLTREEAENKLQELQKNE